jgi:NTE family protein
MGPLVIEQLKIPFTAVAADMLANREVHYRSGDLYKALRASIAIPGVFTPVLENGQFLVDGGVLNPLPLNLIDKKKGEWTIAVNLNGAAEFTPAPVAESDQGVRTLWERLMSLQEVKKISRKISYPCPHSHDGNYCSPPTT